MLDKYETTEDLVFSKVGNVVLLAILEDIREYLTSIVADYSEVVDFVTLNHNINYIERIVREKANLESDEDSYYYTDMIDIYLKASDYLSRDDFCSGDKIYDWITLENRVYNLLGIPISEDSQDILDVAEVVEIIASCQEWLRDLEVEDC